MVPQLSPLHGDGALHWHWPWPVQLTVAPEPPLQMEQAPQWPVASQVWVPLALD
jgi:hypothetical protein